MVTRPYVYEPSKSFGKRITRRLTPFQARRMAQYKLDRPIVSFTFDDCPLSAIDNGVSKLDELGWKSTIYIASALLGTTYRPTRYHAWPDDRQSRFKPNTLHPPVHGKTVL